MKFIIAVALALISFINESSSMTPPSNSSAITAECFDICNKNICGNVLSFRPRDEIIKDKNCHIVLQSGLGSASARQLGEKIETCTSAQILVLGGLDVVLIAGSRKLSIVKSAGIYESTHENEDVFRAVQNLENGNWAPNENVIKLILESLLTYSTSLEAVDWNHKGSAIAKKQNKKNWLQILAFLKENVSKEGIEALKALIPAMARGLGLRGKRHPMLDYLVDALLKIPSFPKMDKESVQEAVLWGRYALHTEAQIAVLQALGDITLLADSQKMNVNLGLTEENCYSLYNPCRSCQGLNWIIEKRIPFLYCLEDNSMKKAGLESWPEIFQIF